MTQTRLSTTLGGKKPGQDQLICCWGIEWEVLTSEFGFPHLHQEGHPEALYRAITSHFTVPSFKIGLLMGEMRLQHPGMETGWVGSLLELVYTSGRGLKNHPICAKLPQIDTVSICYLGVTGLCALELSRG